MREHSTFQYLQSALKQLIRHSDEHPAYLFTLYLLQEQFIFQIHRRPFTHSNKQWLSHDQGRQKYSK